MRNMVVVAHPDDEILGVGATGALLAARGESVRAVILCGAADARTRRPADEELAANIMTANGDVGFERPVLGSFPNIRMNTVPHLEVVQFIETQIAAYGPQRVFTHHPGDLNDDHGAVARACLAAVRLGQRDGNLPMVESVHYMEILSSTDWAFPTNTMPFQPNLYVEIESTLQLKIDALRNYKNVMRDFPHPRSVEVIRGLAAYRGGQSGFRYAEAFQTVFMRGL